MVVMFIFRSIDTGIWQKGAILFVSMAIDADFILSWLYYNDVLGNDQIEQKLKDLLLAFTVIGTVAWLFIASDGIAYKAIYECLVPCFAYALDTIVPRLQTTNQRYFPCSDIRWLVAWSRTAGPNNYYSPGWFSLIGIVFSDIALVALTAIVDNYGGQISPLGAGNIASSAYNLVVRLLDASDTLKEMRQVNKMVEKGFHHRAPITQVLRFSDDRIVTLSSVSWTIKLWNIDSEECIDTAEVAHACWVAKRDDRHLLVGQSVRPFIAKFDMSGDNFTPEDIELHNPLFFDLGSIMNVFPGQELSEWMAFVARLQTTVGRAHLWRAVEYSDDFLLGGTTTGELFIWNKHDPEHRYASVDVDNENGLSFVDCLERNGDEPLIVTIDFRQPPSCLDCWWSQLRRSFPGTQRSGNR
jgi:hypothetical protein